jgi:Golgi SNAP receptor complex protein 1
MTTSWDNARRHARALEQALETKLSSYSKIAAGISRGGPSQPNSREINVEDEGEEGYRLVEEELEELVGKVSDSRWTTNISSSKL